MFVYYIYIYVFQDLIDNINLEIDGISVKVGGVSGVCDSGVSAIQFFQSLFQADIIEITGQKRKLSGWMDGKIKFVMFKKIRFNSLFRQDRKLWFCVYKILNIVCCYFV